MFFLSRLARQRTTVIGFTGTIASGKTARCHRLVQDAFNVQLCGDSNGHGAPDKALTREAALEMAAVVLPSPRRIADPPPTPPAVPVGIKYVNADLVGHDISIPGKPCYDELIQHFGDGVLAHDGAHSSGQPLINRRALGALVFADKAKLAKLNEICWPHISSAIDKHLKDAEEDAFVARKQRHLIVIVEAALLPEMTASLHVCSDIWMTHCTPSIAVTRVQHRDRLSETEAQRRVASQPDVTAMREKLRSAHFTEEAGNLELLDTSNITLEEGLREVDIRFEQLWQRKIRQHME